ncbi:MAG TPA: glycogen/starch/alpha-glucan phosphorylase [Thermoanaerobaculaceae bacterium]|nr:glycogen/starch/alpha-glucan phosphorylase [Thermoanaerobaculaceae bacterium]
MTHRPFPAARPDRALIKGRTDNSVEAIRSAFLANLLFTQARVPERATVTELYLALAATVRDRLIHRWMSTAQVVTRPNVRVACYLSAEFLLGPQLLNNLVALGIEAETREALAGLGIDLAELAAREEEPGLGNGGLGRLAACYLDSLATLEIPAIGYGIRYEFGIFDQEIRDGWQVEVTDKWLQHGNPWEIPRPEIAYRVGFGGRTEAFEDVAGHWRVRWIPDRVVRGVAHDTPVAGYRVGTCLLLRLWRAEAVESFDFQAFNLGDYLGAVDQKVVSENISKVLYPNDAWSQGRQLRLEQQHFFVSCSLQDLLRLHLLQGHSADTSHHRFAVQLNDTHPAIAVAELMRLLVDEHGLPWERAWEVSRRALAYTNHTLLPEALERWPVPLFARLLPRHLEIIYEINRCFLDEVRVRWPADEARAARMSLIEKDGERFVRMAHLATVGSHAVNGVTALHTELLRREVLPDFADLDPYLFHNVTNGVTPRRFLRVANPRLAALLTEAVGDDWVKNLELVRGIETRADDPVFREAWREVKLAAKRDLAGVILSRTDVEVDPSSLFDIQVKRIHEYKRQHLNALHVVTLYNRIRRNPGADIVPRTVIFGGKAAPGYRMAKLIVKLINSIAEVVNADPLLAGRLKVVFLPDFNVTNAQPIYPAADLSEQISTAGKEASGTGNMKFAMNGALTIGTLDGANVEIRDAVGAENFFLFGLTLDQVRETWARGYRPRAIWESDAELQEAINQLAAGTFSRGDTELFRPLVDNLLDHDPFLVLADYRDYVDTQDGVARAFLDPDHWTRMSIVNTARTGCFSSDRAIREYAESIWRVVPVPVEVQ